MDQTATDFERLILNELAKAWGRQSYQFGWGGSGITAPNFRITNTNSHYGQWSADTREMSFSRHLVTKRPWNEVLEILKHEMAHQYVSEVLHADDETSHGPIFQAVCKKHRIDSASRGIPDTTQVDTTNHIVEKVRHLLALANSDNENEAKAAAEMAHKLMLKYNIDLQAKNEEQGYTIRFLGGITGRIQAYMSELANLLSKYYFVEIIWVTSFDPRDRKEGTELEISGTQENVEAAEYVYEFLSRAAVETWEKKFADPVFKLELHKEFAKSFGYSGGAPQTVRGFTISARSNFLHGFIQGFKSQLVQVEIQEKQDGLVLARDIELEKFYRTRHPHIISKGGGGGFNNSSMKNKGFAEGKSLQLAPGMKAAKKFTPLLGK